ncbi:MAG TPA: hypothetical protein VG795_12500 [Acidimicrobiia bacterium]|nr:hypothetical protein [Acidimicrobiia bacterium]
MTDAGYVIGGWALTGAAIAGYVGRLWFRTRKARRLLPPEEQEQSGWR